MFLFRTKDCQFKSFCYCYKSFHHCLTVRIWRSSCAWLWTTRRGLRWRLIDTGTSWTRSADSATPWNKSVYWSTNYCHLTVKNPVNYREHLFLKWKCSKNCLAYLGKERWSSWSQTDHDFCLHTKLTQNAVISTRLEHFHFNSKCFLWVTGCSEYLSRDSRSWNAGWAGFKTEVLMFSVES